MEIKEVLDSYLDKKMPETEVIKGVIGLNADNTLEMGYFSPTLENCEVFYKNEQHIAMTRDIFNTPTGEKLFTTNSSGVVCLRPHTKITASNDLLNVNENYKRSLDYSITGETIAEMKNYAKHLKFTPSVGAKKITQILNGLSVGVELETSKGTIPADVLSTTGLKPLRDGSIGGLEYVTIPLETESDFQLLINSLIAIEKYTESDHSCALHFHFGNVPRTIEFAVALFHTIAVIQPELYLMQPPYKMLNWGIKRKSYSAPLPISVYGKINDSNSMVDNFNYIYEYLSMGQPFKGNFSSLKDVQVHPSDPTGLHKWNITTRYHILNLIPLLFGNKQTVEFRVSEITTNKDVVVSEMLLFATIVNYVKMNVDSITKNIKKNNLLTLRNVIRNVYRNLNIAGTEDEFRIFNYIAEKQNIISSAYRNGDLLTNYSGRFMSAVNTLNATKITRDRQFEVDFVKNNPNVYTLRNNNRRMGVDGVTFNIGNISDVISRSPITTDRAQPRTIVAQSGYKNFKNSVWIRFKTLESRSTATGNPIDNARNRAFNQTIESKTTLRISKNVLVEFINRFANIESVEVSAELLRFQGSTNYLMPSLLLQELCLINPHEIAQRIANGDAVTQVTESLTRAKQNIAGLILKIANRTREMYRLNDSFSALVDNTGRETEFRTILVGIPDAAYGLLQFNIINEIAIALVDSIINDGRIPSDIISLLPLNNSFRSVLSTPISIIINDLLEFKNFMSGFTIGELNEFERSAEYLRDSRVSKIMCLQLLKQVARIDAMKTTRN